MIAVAGLRTSCYIGSRANRLATTGAVAQLGERFNGIEEVEGSSPSSSTKLYRIKNFWGLALKFI